MLKLLELDSILNSTPRNQHSNVAFDVFPDKSSKIGHAVQTNDLIGKFHGLLEQLKLRQPDGLVPATRKPTKPALLASSMKIRWKSLTGSKVANALVQRL